MTTELLALDTLPPALAPQAYTLVAVQTPAGTLRYKALLPSGQGLIPTWTTATRPTLLAGQAIIGFNAQIPQFEAGFGTGSGATWLPLGGSAAGTSAVTITAADMALLVYSLPLTLPGAAGMPWNNGGTIAFAPGTPAGTTALTAAALGAMFASLPTTQAFGAGMPWNNGNTLAVNAGVPSGTTTWTATDLAALFAALPTSPPTTPYQPWNNGRTLAFS